MDSAPSALGNDFTSEQPGRIIFPNFTSKPQVHTNETFSPSPPSKISLTLYSIRERLLPLLHITQCHLLHQYPRCLPPPKSHQNPPYTQKQTSAPIPHSAPSAQTSNTCSTRTHPPHRAQFIYARAHYYAHSASSASSFSGA